MAQYSFPWDGKLGGDSGPYTSDKWSALYRGMSPDQTSSGVLWAIGSENLKATIGGGVITISEGRAMVYGRYYNNSAEEGFAIPATVVDRTDMVVLRATWGGTNNVRLAYKTGTSGSVTPPSLTQTAGTLWEVPLYEIDALAGTIRLDRRSLWQACTLIYRDDFFAAGSAISGFTVSNLPGMVSRYHIVVSGSNATLTSSLHATFNGIQDSPTGTQYTYSVNGAPYTTGVAVFYLGTFTNTFTAHIDIYPNYITQAGVGVFGVTAASKMVSDLGLFPTSVLGGCYGSEPAGLREFNVSTTTSACTFVHAVSVYAFS